MEEPKIKVRLVDSEEKSLQEVERELVENHEKSLIEQEAASEQNTPDTSLEQTSSNQFEIDDEKMIWRKTLLPLESTRGILDEESKTLLN